MRAAGRRVGDSRGRQGTGSVPGGIRPAAAPQDQPRGAASRSEAIAERLGRLGRSWGCPAVRPEVARTVIDTLKGGALLFAYYPDRKWLNESPLLRCGSAAPDSRIAALLDAAPRG